MLWRERVRREVAAMLAEYDAHAQILGIKHIRAVADIIADGLPSPDERNGFVVVPDTLTAKMQDESRTHHGQPFVTQAQWAMMLKAANQ